MAKWPGLPERLREAFRQAGYWKNGRPDVLRFSLEHRFVPGYTYKWIGGTAVPDRENLYRVADTLKVSPSWLLFGDEAARNGRAKRRRPVPIAGGSAQTATPPVAQIPENMAEKRHYVKHLLAHVIGHWSMARPLLHLKVAA